VLGAAEGGEDAGEVEAAGVELLDSGVEVADWLKDEAEERTASQSAFAALRTAVRALALVSSVWKRGRRTNQWGQMSIRLGRKVLRRLGLLIWLRVDTGIPCRWHRMLMQWRRRW
jgi:hypothetical protein